MKKCENCGAPLAPDAHICPNCGKRCGGRFLKEPAPAKRGFKAWIPVVIVMVLAVAAVGFLMLDGQGGKPAPTTEPMLQETAPPTTQPPTQPPTTEPPTEPPVRPPELPAPTAALRRSER